MKKFLSIIVLVLIISMSFAFTACSNATPQGQLGDFWCNKEYFTYTVTDKTVENAPVTGTYFLSIEKKNEGENVTLATDFVLSDVEDGKLVKGYLDINGVTIETTCFFEIASGNNFLVPVASWRKVVESDKTTTTTINYDGTTCTYEIDTNGVLQEGAISYSSPYYDTNEIYNTLRGASTLGTGFSMSFDVPLPAENTAANLTAACSITAKLTSPQESANELYGEGINCYQVNLSRKTDVSGTYYTLFYGTEQMTISNWKITRPLVKIIEGSVEYDLVEVSVLGFID
ncbi:MAG: hypothetical protein PHE93_01785 [Clostridia bacterium]|nr:hypothetical protein [Clostridia bacterium]